VGAGGPIPFTFTATSNVTWLKLTPNRGSVSPGSPEQRVLASVSDWSKVDAGANNAVITFTATSSGQPNASVTVMFTATKNTPPANFKGFVEGSGVISIEAAHSTRNTTVSGVFWKELPDYGRTLSGVTPWPHLGNNENNFTAGTGPTLEYDFCNFNTIGGEGNLTVTVLLTPSFNANGDDRPLGLAIQLDSGTPVASYPIAVAIPGGEPAGWDGLDGLVANSIAPSVTNFTGVSPGAHTLKISMIEPAVVIQKIVIDAGGLRPSYLGPPESVSV